MDGYFEQSVAGRRTMRDAILYALCWALIALLGLAAIFFLMNVVSVGEDGTALRWPCLVGALVSLGLGALIFRRKDYLRLEYDYLFREGALEILDSVTVTSAADGNGTYTVNVTCSGSTFPSRMPYICFLGKSNEVK